MIERRYTGKMRRLITVIAVVAALYHILYIGHIFEYVGIYMLVEMHRAFHVAFVLSLIYLLFPAAKRLSRDRLPWYDALLAVMVVIVPLYIAFSPRSEFLRWQKGDLTGIEVVMAAVTLVLLLEAARRALGMAMPLLAGIFFLYAMYGRYFPGFLQHQGFSLGSTVNTTVFSELGIFGFITGISATIVVMFILFGSFLLASGGGELFIKLASALVGRYRGGPAKVAIVASMFFGMISGSTSANVAGTGTFTIPAMKKLGYSPHFAGAVESVASNGGQFTPPVMGTTAFVMAELLGMPYWTIAVACAVPALIYYVCLYVYVDIEALKLRLRGSPADEIPRLGDTIKRAWIYLVPIAVLLYFIMALRFPPETAALYSVVSIVITSAFRKETRMGWMKLIVALRGGFLSVLTAAVACIAAGVIVSAVLLTGLGPKLTSAIVAASGGNLFLVLIMVALSSFILGMGLSAIAIYLMVVTLVSPALVKMGVPPLAGHLFVFWWGLTSFITPPVCIAVFVACAISGGDVWKTGVTAMRLGMLTYVLPFIWTYQPALLLMGSPADIVRTTVTTLAMVLMLGYAMAGFMLYKWQRLLLGGGVVLLLTFNWTYGAVGAAIGVAVFFLHRRRVQRLRITEEAATDGTAA